MGCSTDGTPSCADMPSPGGELVTVGEAARRRWAAVAAQVEAVESRLQTCKR